MRLATATTEMIAMRIRSLTGPAHPFLLLLQDPSKEIGKLITLLGTLVIGDDIVRHGLHNVQLRKM